MTVRTLSVENNFAQHSQGSEINIQNLILFSTFRQNQRWFSNHVQNPLNMKSSYRVLSMIQDLIDRTMPGSVPPSRTIYVSYNRINNILWFSICGQNYLTFCISETEPLRFSMYHQKKFNGLVMYVRTLHGSKEIERTS